MSYGQAHPFPMTDKMQLFCPFPRRIKTKMIQVVIAR